MTRLSINQAWQETSAIMARDQKLLMAVALALFGLPTALMQWVMPRATQAAMPGWVVGLQLLLLVAALIGTMAISRLVLTPGEAVGSAIGRALRAAPSLVAAMMIVIVPAILAAAILAALLLGASGVEIATADPGQVMRSAGLMFLVLLAVFLLVLPRILLSAPVAVQEQPGPLGLVRRSWRLSRGNMLRLIGLLAMMLLVSMLVVMAVQLLLGSLLQLAGMDLAPNSLGALLLGLSLGLVQAVIGALWAVLLARLYAQAPSGQSG